MIKTLWLILVLTAVILPSPAQADDPSDADHGGAANKPADERDNTDSDGSSRDDWYPRTSVEVRPEIENCEVDWLQADDPPQELDLLCAKAYLRYGYGMHRMTDEKFEERLPGELEYDPFGGSELELRYSRAQLLELANLARRCADEETICDRAVEALELAASRKLGLRDGVNMDEMGAILNKILAGEPLSEKDIYPMGRDMGPTWSRPAYWKLQNAVFARHGLPIADPDLREFFYGELRDDWKDAGLPDLEPDPDATQSALTETDRHNLDMLKGKH